MSVVTIGQYSYKNIYNLDFLYYIIYYINYHLSNPFISHLSNYLSIKNLLTTLTYIIKYEIDNKNPPKTSLV